MPHMDYDWWWGGMHLIWWLFWIALIVGFVFLLRPLRRYQPHAERERPLEILQRRYAAGEITTQEYEERKERLEGNR
jgi:putative membrane protein